MSQPFVVPVLSDAEFDTLLEETLAQPLPEGVGKFAVFDADETLWACDVGEDFFEWFVETERLHPSIATKVLAALTSLNPELSTNPIEALHQLWAGYRQGLYHGVEAYVLMVWCMAGHRAAQLQAWAEARIPSLLEGRVYTEQLDTLHKLERAGIRCFIISASNLWSVRAGAAFLPFPLEQVRAIGLEVHDGLVTDLLIRPMPVDTGKPEVVQQLGLGKPLFGFGDSRYDIPMLSQCHQPILINPKPIAVATAAQHPQLPWKQRHLISPIAKRKGDT
ncbi:MAG: HAD family hydrolase [Myxococcota bacterium]